MIRKSISIAVSIFLLGTITLQQASGCAFSNDPYFTFTNHPDFPLKKYAAGQLGIIQPGYARSYLLVAYRYLSAQPLSSEEQKNIVGLWDDRLNDAFFDESSYADNTTGIEVDGNGLYGANRWLKARKAVPGAIQIDNIDTDRSVSKEESWQTYCNCQPDAFNTAAKKLNEFVTKYGASSDTVKQWLQAQDDVFSNCSTSFYSDKPKEVKIPEALPSTVEPPLQKDRAYQIAAANFYAQNFEVARKEFEDIAADNSSPWQQISAYLAIRAMVRQATLAKVTDTKLLASAKEKLNKLQADSAYAAMAESLAKIDSYINARLIPEKSLQNLTAEKITSRGTGELTKLIDLVSGDNNSEGATDVSYESVPDSLKSPDLIDWIMSFQSTDDAGKKHIIERWQKTHSLPWLVAAASSVDGDNPNAGAIAAAAEKEQDNSAKWTLLYHSNRINIEQNKSDAVRIKLDKVLSAPPPDLQLSSLNQFKIQRLTLAKNLDEFVKFGIQNPVCICTSGGTEQVPDDVAKLEKMEKMPAVPAVFTPEAADIMDNKLPLSSLVVLAANPKIPTDLRSHLAWTAWVRAILVGDETRAKNLATILKSLNKAKQKLVETYLAANTAEARKFAAVFLMMQFSSAQPNVGYGPLSQDDYGDDSGWWWMSAPLAKYDNVVSPPVEMIDPLFLSAVQKQQTKKDLALLAKVAPAPNYFCQTVLAWAKAHPDDERMPQALHFAVKSTRYGVTNDSTTGLSKQCFQLLHSRYKTSSWAKKTPYWY